MKQIILLAFSILFAAFSSNAQLYVNGTTVSITPNTIVSVDGLILTPSTTLNITNNTINKANTATVVNGKNSISRKYTTTNPINVTGLVGIMYDATELNGNTESSLKLATAATSNGAFTLSTTSSTNSAGSYYITDNVTNKTIGGITAVTNCTPTSSNTSITACNNYAWNGTTYTTSGTYTTTGLVNSVGCDSSATLNLTINSPTSSTTTVSACSSYLWNGTTYTSGGTYTYTTTNSVGCDSVASLVLTIKSATSSTNYLTIFSSQLPYTWNGLVFTQAGTKTKTELTNAAGCDSSATLVLTVSNTLTITGATSVCVGSTAQLSSNFSGGVWVSYNVRATVNQSGLVTGVTAGTATIIYTLGNASTSINITVNALPAAPSMAYASGYTNPQGNGGFCKNRTFGVVGSPANGVWTKTGAISITPNGTAGTNAVISTGTTTGAFSIIYTTTNANGCSNSRTFSNNVVVCANKGINQSAVNNQQFTVYPNPAKNILNIKADRLVGIASIVITDLLGKQLKHQTISMGNNIIDISNFTKGMYLVTIITEQGKETRKIIVE